MDNLEFRKFITEYGVTNDEYEEMPDEEKRKILIKFNAKSRADNLSKAGDGFKGCGCLIMLFPLLLALLYLLLTFIKSMF